MEHEESEHLKKWKMIQSVKNSHIVLYILVDIVFYVTYGNAITQVNIGRTFLYHFWIFFILLDIRKSKKAESM